MILQELEPRAPRRERFTYQRHGRRYVYSASSGIRRPSVSENERPNKGYRVPHVALVMRC